MTSGTDLEHRDLDAFAQATAQVERAEKNTSKLDGEIAAWLPTHTTTSFRNRDLEGFKYVVEAVFTWEEVPPKYRTDAASIIAILRDAIISASRVFDPSFEFPAAGGDGEDSASQVAGMIDKFPEPVRGSIESLDVDVGGDGDPLRAIFELIGRDENQLLEVAPAPDHGSLRKIASSRHIRHEWDARLRPADKSLVVFSAAAGRKCDHDFEIPLQIIFGGVNVSGVESATDVLLAACKNVTDLIFDLECACK